MERLTKYLASGAATYDYPADCYSGVDCNDRVAKSVYRQLCVERLAAYENTGLEPEEVLPKDKADEIALNLMRLADLERLCSYTRLRELAEADKDGRLVVLPCKPGDTVYMISWRLNGRHEIEERVFSLTYFDPAKYGKDYFLSREEAEKALEAKE